MSPSRRALLKASVPVALGGAGLGYWQRRRIRRRDDLEALERTAALETPCVDEPLIVPDEVVQAGYEDAHTHLEQTEELADEVPEETEVTGLDRRLDQTVEALEGNPPAEMDTDSDRQEALESYRLAMANSGSARGSIIVETEDEADAREIIRDRLDELEAICDDLEISYTGASFTTAIVQYGVVDEWVGQAAERLSRVDDRTIQREEPNPVNWETLAMGRFDLETAARQAEALEGRDVSDAFDSGYESLADRTGSIVDEAPFELEDDVNTYALGVWQGIWDAERPAENAHESGRFARALRDQTQALVIAKTLEEFGDVPESRAWGGREADIPSTGDELLEATTTAVADLEAAIGAAGDDPLGRWLLEESVRNLTSVQSSADRLREGVRSIAAADWTRQLAHATLRSRRAGTYATAVPEVLERVQSFDPT